MGGEGSILAMITSLKNNKALLQSGRRKRLEQEVRHHASGPLVFDNKMEPEQFEAFKRRLRKDRLLADIGKVLMLAVSIAIGGYLAFLMFRALLSL